MLNSLRNASKTWVIRIFFGLLALSFVSWGVGDVMTGRFGSSPAVKVGKTEISTPEVMGEFKRQVERLQPLFGGKLTAEDAKRLGLMERTVDTIVSRTLIDEAARALGLVGSDDIILRQIAANPTFRDSKGQFDRTRLTAALQRAGYTEESYLRLERQNLIRGQMADIAGSGLKPPSVLTDGLIRYHGERRVAEIISIADAALPAVPTPDAATLEKFHKDNAERFMAPEYRAMTVLRVTPASIAGKITVTDQMVAEAYDQRRGEFQIPERREISQLILESEADAAKVQTMGKDLAAAAKALSTTVIDLGEVEKADLPPELTQPAFSAASGTLTAPARTALGWHVMKIGKILPGKIRTLDEVKAQLREDLKREKAVDQLTELANAIDDALGGGATLEEAAKRLDLTGALAKFAATDIQGRGTDGKPVALPRIETLLDTAFRTETGAESQMAEDGADGFYMLRVDDVVAPQPKSFAAVRADVLTAWQSEQRQVQLQELASKIAERLKAGEPSSRVAQGPGLKLQTSQPFTRDAVGSDLLPPAVVAELFRARPDGVAMGSGKSGHVVAKLVKILPHDPVSQGDLAEATRQRLTQALSADLTDQLINALRAEMGVKIDRSQLFRDE